MTLQLVNDGERYSVAIADYFHQKNYVVYVLTILDQCFNQEYKLCFRYNALKNIHEKLQKQQKVKHLVPDFPRKRSFLFVNKTNRSYRNIQDRARQLQYYVFKLLNVKQLSARIEVKGIVCKAKQSFPARRRSKSECKGGDRERRSSCSLECGNGEKTVPGQFQVEYL